MEKDNVQHVFLVGAKSLGAYGGFPSKYSLPTLEVSYHFSGTVFTEQENPRRKRCEGL